MQEWRQTIVTVCTMLLALVALATYVQFGFAALRADMNAEHGAIREQLNSVDRRTARIEGHLFGIEIPQEPVDGE